MATVARVVQGAGAPAAAAVGPGVVTGVVMVVVTAPAVPQIAPAGAAVNEAVVVDEVPRATGPGSDATTGEEPAEDRETPTVVEAENRRRVVVTSSRRSGARSSRPL